MFFLTWSLRVGTFFFKGSKLKGIFTSENQGHALCQDLALFIKCKNRELQSSNYIKRVTSALHIQELPAREAMKVLIFVAMETSTCNDTKEDVHTRKH